MTSERGGRRQGALRPDRDHRGVLADEAMALFSEIADPGFETDPRWGLAMIIARLAKALLVAAIALFASPRAFGNITDDNTNLAFVQHSLPWTRLSVLPPSNIARSPTHAAAACLCGDLATEVAIAVLCWIGVADARAPHPRRSRAFNRAKTFAVIGLTSLLLWEVGFMSIGGDGSACAVRSNGTAFRARSLPDHHHRRADLVAMPDQELEGEGRNDALSCRRWCVLRHQAERARAVPAKVFREQRREQRKWDPCVFPHQARIPRNVRYVRDEAFRGRSEAQTAVMH